VTEGNDRLIAGKYRLKDTLGEGAIGVVWRAHDESLDRDVAIKEVRLPPGIGPDEVKSLHARTLREARSAARLTHPGIIIVHDVVHQDDQPWIVMELIRGGTLQQIVKADGPQTPQRTAEIGAKILAGLRAAHAAGIVHRDIKPSNVLFDGERTVLTDFGIAALDGGTILTQTGAVLGTPAFMSPEQARGQAVTAASDLWSLGATLYATVEGHPPFAGESLAAVLFALVTTDPPCPGRAGPLTPVIGGLLVKDPSLRMPADDLAAQLTRIANGGGPARLQTPQTVPENAGPPRRGVFRRAFTALARVNPVRTIRGRRRPHPRSVAILIASVLLITAASIGLPQLSRSHPPVTPSRTPAVRIGHLFPSVPLTSDTNVFSVAFNRDGKQLASGCSDSTLRLWNVTSRTQLAQLARHTDSIVDLAYSPDGKQLATAGSDKTVRLWDVASDSELAVLTGHTAAVWSVNFSPDGKTLASSSKDGTIRLWDVISRKPAGVLGGRSKPVTSVAFSRDGTLASGSWDHTVRLWDVGSRTQIATLNGHTDTVLTVAFSPDGKILASAGQDDKVLLWEVRTHLGIGVLSGHGHDVESVAFSPDGRTLASGADDHKIMLWNFATNTRLGVLAGHKDEVYSVAFSPDGRTLASGAGDKSIRLWNLTQ
jgi:serine/threonine protein kinase